MARLLASLLLPAVLCHPSLAFASSMTPMPIDGCFGETITAAGMPAGVAGAIVQVAIVDHSGVPRVSGTGTLIETQASEPIVLTAWHIVAVRGDERIAIVSSTAEVLGEGVVVVEGSGIAPRIASEISTGDLAALRVTWSGDASRRAGNGLRLSHRIEQGGLIVGVLNRPGGAVPGVSGAPVLDSMGNVIAVVVARTRSSAPEPDLDIHGGDLLRMHASGHVFIPGVIRAPRASGFAAEVPGASMASIGMVIAENAEETVTKVVVPGIVRGHCVTFEGSL